MKELGRLLHFLALKEGREEEKWKGESIAMSFASERFGEITSWVQVAATAYRGENLVLKQALQVKPIATALLPFKNPFQRRLSLDSSCLIFFAISCVVSSGSAVVPSLGRKSRIMREKLDALLRRNFKTSKFKSLLDLTITRIGVLKNQRRARLAQSRKDVLELLKREQQETALLRVFFVDLILYNLDLKGRTSFMVFSWLLLWF